MSFISTTDFQMIGQLQRPLLRTLVLFASCSFVATIAGETVAALLFDQWDRDAGTAIGSILESATIRAPLAALWGAATVVLALRTLHRKRNVSLGQVPLTGITMSAAIVPVCVGHFLTAIEVPGQGLERGSTENALLLTYLVGPVLVFSLGYWLFSARIRPPS